MTNITINYLLKEIHEINTGLLTNWLEKVVLAENMLADNIQIILCDDNTLHDLNKKYLNHNTLTDVITFNYNDEYENLAGDIYISYERIKENAITYNVSTDEELQRVMVHGVLHLIGYDDHTEEQRKLMRDKENYYLSLI